MSGLVHVSLFSGVGGVDLAMHEAYKQMGNAVAVPVFAWVARRIAAVDKALAPERAA